MRVAVESDNKLDGALSSVAAAACPGDLRLPIGLLLVKAAKGLAPFRDGRPRLVRAGRIGDKATGRNGNLTRVRGFALGHAETAGLFGRGGKLRGHLGVSIHEWPPQETHTEDKKNTFRPHGLDRSTVSSLAATDTTA